MKEIIVLSGKGGTGKTTIVAALAALALKKVIVDCDVDAADLHLVLQPRPGEEREFRSGHKAYIDLKKCTRCGLCLEACRRGAIDDFAVEPLSCEGCGFCFHICPEHAVTMRENLSGRWYISPTPYGPLVHARLEPGQENSGKLVSLVRREARLIAERDKLDFVLGDGPPGIGCPVISALSGVDLALLVTEPTLSAMHDLERVLSVCRHFGIPPLVCINKFDINEDNTRQIEAYCLSQGIQVAARIPFDNAVTEAMVHGLPVVEYVQNGVARQVEALWELVSELLTE